MRGHITVPSEEECPDELRQLIQDCMHREPDKRPSATEVFRYGISGSMDTRYYGSIASWW